MKKVYEKPTIAGLTDKLIKPDFLDVANDPEDPDNPTPVGSSVEDGEL